MFTFGVLRQFLIFFIEKASEICIVMSALCLGYCSELDFAPQIVEMVCSTVGRVPSYQLEKHFGYMNSLRGIYFFLLNIYLFLFCSLFSFFQCNFCLPTGCTRCVRKQMRRAT